MARHISFWIGFFLACLLIIPISIGAWGVLEQKIFDWVAILFGVVAVLVFGLAIVLLFRDRIFHMMFGRAEASIDDVARSVVGLVQSASQGSLDQTIDASGNLSRTILAWYSWSSMYRWVIQTALALLVALGAFAGTVLLFEQTRTLREQTIALQDQTLRFREQTGLMSEQRDLMQAQTDSLTQQVLQATIQNEILTVTLVSELRRLLLLTSEEIQSADFFMENSLSSLDGELVSSTDGQCRLNLQENAVLQTLPAEASINAIADLARDGELSAEVRKALGFLIDDRNSAISLGAYAALDRIGAVPESPLPALRNLLIEGLELQTQTELVFENSLVAGLKCMSCTVEFQMSFFSSSNEDVSSIYSGDSIVFEGLTEDITELDGSFIRLAFGDVPEEFSDKRLSSGDNDVLDGAYLVSTAFINDETRGTICNSLRAFALESRLWRYSDGAQ